MYVVTYDFMLVKSFLVQFTDRTAVFDSPSTGVNTK